MFSFTRPFLTALTLELVMLELCSLLASFPLCIFCQGRFVPLGPFPNLGSTSVFSDWHTWLTEGACMPEHWRACWPQETERMSRTFPRSCYSVSYPLVGGFGCDELVLYGIRELA